MPSNEQHMTHVPIQAQLMPNSSSASDVFVSSNEGFDEARLNISRFSWSPLERTNREGLFPIICITTFRCYHCSVEWRNKEFPSRRATWTTLQQPRIACGHLTIHGCLMNQCTHRFMVQCGVFSFSLSYVFRNVVYRAFCLPSLLVALVVPSFVSLFCSFYCCV